MDMSASLHFPALCNDHILRWPVVLGPSVLYLVYDVHSFNHASEDDVLVVQERCGGARDEELASIRVRSGVLKIRFSTGRLLSYTKGV